jgi:hypothetical protein
MEDDFPSAGPFSRTDFFWAALTRKATRPGDDVAARAVRTLDAQLKQNAVVSAIADALRTWAADDPHAHGVIAGLLAEFVSAYSFPKIPGAATATIAEIADGDVRRAIAEFFRDEREAMAAAGTRPKGEERIRAVASSLPELMELEDLSSLLSIT